MAVKVGDSVNTVHGPGNVQAVMGGYVKVKLYRFTTVEGRRMRVVAVKADEVTKA